MADIFEQRKQLAGTPEIGMAGLAGMGDGSGVLSPLSNMCQALRGMRRCRALIATTILGLFSVCLPLSSQENEKTERKAFRVNNLFR